RLDLLPADADRGNGRQGREQAGLVRRIRNRGCALSAAPRDALQRPDAVAGCRGHRDSTVCGLGRDRLPPHTAPEASASNSTDIGGDLISAHRPVEAHFSKLDTQQLRAEFVRQGAFIYLDEFLAPEVTAQLMAAAAA